MKKHSQHLLQQLNNSATKAIGQIKLSGDQFYNDCQE